MFFVELYKAYHKNIDKLIVIIACMGVENRLIALTSERLGYGPVEITV